MKHACRHRDLVTISLPARVISVRSILCSALVFPVLLAFPALATQAPEVIAESSTAKGATSQTDWTKQWVEMIPEERMKRWPAMDPVKDDPALPRVLLIGDSISIGYTVPVRNRLKGKANVHRIPDNGRTTAYTLERLSRWLGPYPWDVIHFNWGLHDCLTGDLNKYESNLEELLRRLRATGATLIWATTTPIPEGVKLRDKGRRKGRAAIHNNIAKKVMKQHGIMTNDLYAFALPQLDKIQIPANVHFHRQGSEVLGAEVARHILAALQTRAAKKPQEPRRPKPPFRVLYSNDTTNLMLPSPYHKTGAPLTDDVLRGSVDEAAGCDVHLLQPGMGWIPWWKSKQYPAEEHYQWFTKRTGRKPDVFGQYMLNGGDMVKVFIERCREKGQAPFISFRLNDAHHLNHAGTRHPGSIWSSQFYTEHPEYRLGEDPENWSTRVHNWMIPEVREYKFAFIKEICEQYDIDGFELDFLRQKNYFKIKETTKEQRCRIMIDFVRRVRNLLDRTARPGQHRWLCIRVPAILFKHDHIGVDLPAMIEAGVDMVNASAYFWTQQQNDVAAIRHLVPQAALYLEMAHHTMSRSYKEGDHPWFRRRTTEQQYYTGAHLAYTHGADGISLFNFVYYRQPETQGQERGNEPPFHLLDYLDQPDWLAKQPQWYVLTRAYSGRYLPPQDRPMPRRLQASQKHTVKLDMAPTKAQTTDGVLRIMTKEPSSDCKWTITLNDTQLDAIPFVAKPIDHPYEAGLGKPNQYACFKCPRSLVKNGSNTITITLNEGPEVTVYYLDLVLP